MPVLMMVVPVAPFTLRYNAIITDSIAVITSQLLFVISSHNSS